MKTLGQRWAIFRDIIFDPALILLLLATLGLIAASLNQPPAAISGAIFSVLATLAAAILGARAWELWTETNDAGALNARGNLSVRNLSLLLQSISALNVRLKLFLKETDQIRNNPQATERNYEEAINSCNLLLEQTVSAIESWTDIVPGADVKTQIGLFTKLTGELKEKEAALSNIKNSLDALQGQQSEVKKRLEQQLKDIQREIDAQKRQLQVASVGGTFSGSTITTLSELLKVSPNYGSGIIVRSSPEGAEGGTLLIKTPDSGSLTIGAVGDNRATEAAKPALTIRPTGSNDKPR